MTDAHDTHMTMRFIEHTPMHEPRESDPHYRIFHQARERMRKAGLLKRAIDGCQFPGPIELHHDKIEFSLQGGVDLNLFNQFYGLHLADDEAFRAYIETEGNLEPLCPVHHRTHLGIHALPGPMWTAIRVWRKDLVPPAEADTTQLA